MATERMFDRLLIGVVVRREISRRFGSVATFVTKADLSRKTVERVMNGDGNVTFETLERVEGALKLPRDTLAMVGAHDLDGLREIEVESDLVRWIGGELKQRQAPPTEEGPSKRRTG